MNILLGKNNKMKDNFIALFRTLIECHLNFTGKFFFVELPLIKAEIFNDPGLDKDDFQPCSQNSRFHLKY